MEEVFTCTMKLSKFVVHAKLESIPEDPLSNHMAELYRHGSKMSLYLVLAVSCVHQPRPTLLISPTDSVDNMFWPYP